MAKLHQNHCLLYSTVNLELGACYYVERGGYEVNLCELRVFVVWEVK